MKILAIDPGLRHCGCALFDYDAGLQAAWLAKNRERKLRGPGAWRAMAGEVFKDVRDILRSEGLSALVLEVPKVYAGGKAVGDPADLIEIAGVDGALTTVFPEVSKIISYFPRDWKGTVEKSVMTKRILSHLSPHERDVLGEWEKDHNVVDAVGIGKHYLERSKK